MEYQIETRWVVVDCDGRHVTLGRHSDPNEEDISRAERALKAQGLSGWLALMKGEYYEGRRTPSLMMIRPLGEPGGEWDQATAAFEVIRKRALRPS